MWYQGFLWMENEIQQHGLDIAEKNLDSYEKSDIGYNDFNHGALQYLLNYKYRNGD